MNRQRMRELAERLSQMAESQSMDFDEPFVEDELDEKFNENLVRGRIPKEEHAAVWDLAVKAVLDVLGVQA